MRERTGGQQGQQDGGERRGDGLGVNDGEIGWDVQTG